MAKVIFYKREYEIPSDFTNREMMECEKISGLSAPVISKAIVGGEAPWSLLIAWAWIAMQRAGTDATLDDLLDAKPDDLDWVNEEAEAKEADAGPPSQTPTEPGEPNTLNGNDGSTSSNSLTGEIPDPSGSRSSPTFSESTRGT